MEYTAYYIAWFASIGQLNFLTTSNTGVRKDPHKLNNVIRACRNDKCMLGDYV